MVEARLYLSGYAVLPGVFVFGAINGPTVTSPLQFGLLAVAGAWGILTVKYLPRGARGKGVRERDVFRSALRTVHVEDERWAFLWHVSMGLIVGGLAVYWLRFVIPAWFS